MSQVFKDEVCGHLGCYVYRLVDPRNGHTFYVGKGKGNRVFSHARNELKEKLAKENSASDDDVGAQVEDAITLKSQLIKEIINDGHEVMSIIHRHGMNDETALEVEAALMDAYPELTNIQGGYASNERGCMSPEQIITQYALPAITVPPAQKILLLNINNLENRNDPNAIYEQTRLAWRASKARAKKADLILGVERGIVRGVFVADDWKYATPENFPGRVLEDMAKRIGFVGRPAPDDIWDEFVGLEGKRIEVDGMRHIQNPVRYWNIP